jgi:hypothetical protein
MRTAIATNIGSSSKKQEFMKGMGSQLGPRSHGPAVFNGAETPTPYPQSSFL